MKSIDFKAAQCFISLNDSDVYLLNSSSFDSNLAEYIYSVDRGLKIKTFKLSRRRRRNSYICSNYDIPMYLDDVSGTVDTSQLKQLVQNLTIFKKIEHFEDLLFSFFLLDGKWLLKYSCRCLDDVHYNDFPVCSKLSRIIDCKVNTKLLDLKLPALLEENAELMSSVQSVLELKYSLDQMWKYGNVDSVREWTIFNWIVELTLRVRRLYNVDLTLNLEPKYFGYPDAESVRISNDLKTLVVNSKSNGCESSYLKFMDALESVMEA